MKIQSNGMGVQSVALYLMSSLGQLPRLDASIFSDPGKEKMATYDYLKWLIDWSNQNKGIKLINDKSKNLYNDLLNGENSLGQRFASIPAYTKNEDGSTGMVRRQCTNEYKIEVVMDNIRKITDTLKHHSFSKPVELWIGISLDEIDRVSIPERKNLTYVYPFCNYYRNQEKGWFGKFKPMTRADLYKWYKENDFPIPVKSSCVFCPFQADSNWLHMKKNFPKDFNEAIKIDYAIRNSSKKGIKNKLYLHKSLKPLDKVEFKENQTEIEFTCGPFCNV